MENSYLQIFDMIKDKIDSGEYKPHDAVPSEKTLGEMTGIGRSTVRKGLAKLISEGYIYTVQGKGYYVCAPKSGEFILYFNETEAIETSANSINIIGADIIAPAQELSNILKLPPNKNVVLLKRLIADNKTRIAYDCKYIPYSAKSPIVEKELYNADFPQMFTKEKSLFDIKKNIKITIGKLDQEAAKALRAKENEPIIIIEQRLFDENNEPIGYGVTKFLGRYFKIKAVSE